MTNDDHIEELQSLIKDLEEEIKFLYIENKNLRHEISSLEDALNQFNRSNNGLGYYR